MSRLILLLLILLALIPRASAAQAAKIFPDKGSTWIRADNKKLLKVGAEHDVVADEKSTASLGKAVIMEVNGMLARVNVDEAATKAGGKFVLLAKGGGKGGGSAEAA